MPAKKVKSTLPTRRSIETLLKELNGYITDDASYKAYSDADDAIEEFIENHPTIKLLRKRRDALYQKWANKRKILKDRITAVRKTYLAEGITPAVLKELKALVALSNKP